MVICILYIFFLTIITFLIYEDNIWKEYLEQLYEGPELTGQEMKHDERVLENWLNYGVLREEFDKALRDLKRKKYTGINKIQAKLRKESDKKIEQ